MHLQEQMLRHKAQYRCAVSCFGSRNMLKHASGVSGLRNFFPTRKRPLELYASMASGPWKKGLFEFPRKVLLLYQGEEVYTKIAIRWADGYFAYTRVSVFLRLLLVPVGAEHAQVAAVAPLSVLLSGSEELGCLGWVLLHHRSEVWSEKGVPQQCPGDIARSKYAARVRSSPHRYEDIELPNTNPSKSPRTIPYGKDIARKA